MTRQRQESLLVTAGVSVAFMSLVAFLDVLLSPMVAAFVAGLGLGAVGVYALLRLARSDVQPD